jgi:hypothetical protein
MFRPANGRDLSIEPEPAANAARRALFMFDRRRASGSLRLRLAMTTWINRPVIGRVSEVIQKHNVSG